MDEPPKKLPELRKLLREPGIFKKAEDKLRFNGTNTKPFERVFKVNGGNALARTIGKFLEEEIRIRLS